MIEIQNVSKVYPGAKVKAVDGVSLTIPSGEFFGLLGPNGAGKTTMISMLSTLLIPNEGQILIDGEVLDRQRGSSFLFLVATNATTKMIATTMMIIGTIGKPAFSVSSSTVSTTASSSTAASSSTSATSSYTIT